MSWRLRVLTSPTADSSACILAEFDNERYLFGCAEGTTRNITQRRLGTKYLKAIFMGGLGEETGGLPGLIMSLADGLTTELTLCGPPNFNYLVASFRRYCFRPSVDMVLKETGTREGEGDEGLVWKGKSLQVWAVPVVPERWEADVKGAEDERQETEILKGKGVKRKRQEVDNEDSAVSPDSSVEAASPTKEAAPIVLEGPSTGPRFLPPNPLLLRYIRGGKARALSSPVKPTIPSSLSIPHVPILPTDLSLIARWFDSDFVASSLTGRAAYLWTHLCAAAMFRPPPGSSDEVLTEDIASDPSRSPPPSTPPGTLTPRALLRAILLSLQPLPPPPQPRLPTAVTYIGIGPKIRGKFLVDKAVALGVPAGPLRGALTEGKSVVLQDGREVKPEDCVLPGRPPSVFFIVECPETRYVHGVVNSQRLNGYRPDPADAERPVVHCIVHKVGTDVLRDDRYVEWMRSFGPDVEHVIANREYCANEMNMISGAYVQLRLGALDRDVFRVPFHSLSPPQPLSTLPSLPEKSHAMRSSLVVPMYPASSPTTLPIQKDLFHPLLASLPAVRPVPPDWLQIQNVVARVAKDRQTKPGDDVRVVALGTGSAMPSKYRNVSATLLQMEDGKGVLLDAGEGTWGQMARHFGDDRVVDVLRELRVLFLSHIHGDHHMGTSKLLRKRRLLDPPARPLYLIASQVIVTYLREYHVGVEDLGLDDPAFVRVIDTEHILDSTVEAAANTAPNSTVLEQSLTCLEELKNELDLSSVLTVEVPHRVKAHGLVMRRRDGFSFAYSGDSMPSSRFIRAGRGVSLLIHESTFGSEEKAQAKDKAHSTADQAIEVGQNMRAENTFLTHFSQRYPKLPSHEFESLASISAADQDHSNDRFRTTVSTAFDHLSMRVGDLWKMQYYAHGIEQLFAEDEDDDHDPDDQGKKEEIEKEWERTDTKGKRQQQVGKTQQVAKEAKGQRRRKEGKEKEMRKVALPG